MARLWAQKIMLGERQFSEVPRLLKDQVRKILTDNGVEHLAEEASTNE